MIDLDADAGGAEPDRIIDVHGDLLVGELLCRIELPPRQRSTTGLLTSAGIDRPQRAARAHQRVGIGSSGTMVRSMRSSPVVGPWK